MQTTIVPRDPASTGLFRTLPLITPMTFEAATALRKVLKEATQYAGLGRGERQVCMHLIDDIDEVLARFAESTPR